MHAEFSYNKASISILHTRDVLVEQYYKPVKIKYECHVEVSFFVSSKYLQFSTISEHTHNVDITADNLKQERQSN